MHPKIKLSTFSKESALHILKLFCGIDTQKLVLITSDCLIALEYWQVLDIVAQEDIVEVCILLEKARDFV